MRSKVGPASKPVLVVISHLLPRSHAGNAGQNYLSGRVRVWKQRWDVRIIAIPGLSSETEIHESLCETHVLQRRQRSVPLRLLSNRIRRTFKGVADPALAHDLKHDSLARSWLSSADAVVLEWQETAGNCATVRRFAPQAALVAVFHDVVSQSVRRYAQHAADLQSRAKFQLVRMTSKIAEKFIMGNADIALILSKKDAALLPGGRAQKIVVPPIIEAPAQVHRRPAPNRLVMVAGWRAEDVESLRWFAREVLPLLAADGLRPEVHLIGRMQPALAQEFGALGMLPLGYVDDLSTAYERAAAAIVPLQLGAGVKFKTVEAVLHGVPLVSTFVGAEGIQGLEHSDAVCSTAAAFADRLEWILNHPDLAEQQAQQTKQLVEQHHGVQAFEAAMGELNESLTRIRSAKGQSRRRLGSLLSAARR